MIIKNLNLCSNKLINTISKQLAKILRAKSKFAFNLHSFIEKLILFG